MRAATSSNAPLSRQRNDGGAKSMSRRPVRGMVKWMLAGFAGGLLLFGGYHMLFHEPEPDIHAHESEGSEL